MHIHSFVLFALDILSGRAQAAFRVALIASACALSACSSMKIVRPADQSTASNSTVPVVIEFSDRGYTDSTFSASLDGVDRTSSFTLAWDQATATFTMLAPGSHTLAASADVYDKFYLRDVAHKVVSTFVVPGPSFTLESDESVVVRRNGDPANLNVTISPVGGFSAPVVLSVLNLPPGINAATTTLPAGSTTGRVVLQTIDGGADYSERTLTLRAEGGGVVATKTFILRVFHVTGPFAKASFAVTTPPETAVSSSGAVQLTARRGTDAGLPSAFAAIYERQGGMGSLGQPIPFNHGQTNVQNQVFGGAGFCAGSTAGFVFAGKGPGVVAPPSAQYVASVLEFTNPSLVGQVDIAAFRSSGTLYYFEPAMYFSQDCMLAIAVGAHPTGPENNLAQVIHLKSSSFANRVEFSAPSFTASVVDAGTHQRIEFTSGGQTKNINLP